MQVCVWLTGTCSCISMVPSICCKGEGHRCQLTVSGVKALVEARAPSRTPAPALTVQCVRTVSSLQTIIETHFTIPAFASHAISPRVAGGLYGRCWTCWNSCRSRMAR